MTSVAVLDDYQRVALTSADWSGLPAEVTVFDTHLDGAGAVVAALAGFDVVVAMRERTPFPAEVLRRLPALRLLVTTGAANASIDVGAARSLGITVCGTGASAASAPELTWALLMALVRHVPTEDANVRAGRWQTTVGRDLDGATLGLLGLGRIGQRMARYGAAFGMTVLAWSQNLTAATAGEHGATLVTREALFERSDVVSVHVKLSDRTRGLVGADELRRLGPDGLLVNTSRGPIVDEAALLAALRDGTIAGAALDVFGTEPLPADSPWRTAPNTVLTPHVGYVTREQYGVFYRDAVEDVRAWLAGAPVREL
jgi:phosphoglycerate dehydrogenase-like enzyme